MRFQTPTLSFAAEAFRNIYGRCALFRGLMCRKKQRPYALNIPDAANGNLIIDNIHSSTQSYYIFFRYTLFASKTHLVESASQNYSTL